MRFLQISDLHLRNSFKLEDETGKILTRFFDIISKNAKIKPFDFVVITGDIRNKPDGISAECAFELLTNIFKHSELTSKNQLHVVPGNHDLERGDKGIVENAIKNYDLDNGVFSSSVSILSSLVNRFEDFFLAVCDTFYEGKHQWSDSNINPHNLIYSNNVALLFLNSSLTSQENSKDGRLLVGRIYIKALLESIDLETTKGILIFSHHPIKDLQNREKTLLTKLLNTYRQKGLYVFWFCGDSHSNTFGDEDGVPYFQVGSLCLTQKEKTVVIPDFVIYEVDEMGKISRNVFRFLQHLNCTSASTGGWKRVYTEPNDLE